MEQGAPVVGSAVWEAVAVVATTRGDGLRWPASLIGPARPRSRSLPGRAVRWAPTLLAVAVVLAAVVLLPREQSPPSQVWLALAPVAGLALALRRPLLGWRVLLVWQVLLAAWVQVTGHDTNVLVLLAPWGLLPTLYVATRCTGGAARVGVLGWSAVVAWACWAQPYDPETTVQLLGLVSVAGALGWSAGLLDDARARADVQRARAQRSERDAVVLQERARIARELHDVVAHRVAVIAVRCESAPHRIPGVGEAVQRELAGIAQDAREAMRELHDVLSVLPCQSTSGEPSSVSGVVVAGVESRRPAPGVHDLPEAVERAVAAGARVHLLLDEDAASVLSASQGLTAYRVVTQALANALEHAPGARVHITVVRGDPSPGCVDQVRIDVVNGAPTSPAAATRDDPDERTGRGTGIDGMRERVALHGGDLLAAGTPSGGFHVSVTLPLHQRAGL